MLLRAKQALSRVPEITWVLLLALLPITSLPLLSKVAGASMVMPPSGVLLLILVVIWLLPALARRMTLPPQVSPLFVFAGVALVSSLLAYFQPFPAFRDENFTIHMLEAGLTLAVGVCMFLVAAAFPQDEAALRRTLAWIDAGGLVIILWSLAQTFLWQEKTQSYPAWMNAIQSLISISRIYPARATGLAFEPSWLAHQLNILYLPFWLAASARRTSAFRQRLLGISFENLALVGGVAVLWFSYSRVGLVSLLFMLGLLVVKANIWLVGWITDHIGRRSPADNRPARPAGRLLALQISAALFIFYLALILATGLMVARLNPKMGKMLDFSNLSQGNILAYANQISIAERVVYWQTGLDVFNDYPALGVGLGNTGYFFPEKISPFGWSLVEVENLMFNASNLPNTKSMWVRLLSETGLVGFSVFLGWFLVVWFTGGSVQRRRSSLILQTFGLAGQLAVLAFIVEGFSIDSFALPYLWVTLGLAVSAWRVRK